MAFGHYNFHCPSGQVVIISHFTQSHAYPIEQISNGHLVVQIPNPYNLGPKLKLSFEPSDIFELCPRFLEVKRNVALPEDVWLVDLDEAKIFPPETCAEVR